MERYLRTAGAQGIPLAIQIILGLRPVALVHVDPAQLQRRGGDPIPLRPGAQCFYLLRTHLGAENSSCGRGIDVSVNGLICGLPPTTITAAQSSRSTPRIANSSLDLYHKLFIQHIMFRGDKSI